MQEGLEVAVTAGDENIRRESQLYDGGVQLGFPWWIREHGALQNQTPSQYIVPSSSSSSSSSSSNDHASLMNNAEAFFPSQRQDAAIQASDSSGYGKEHLPSSTTSTTTNLLPTDQPMLPHTQLELGHSVVQSSAYPPYFGAIMTAYATQAMVHPYVFGIEHSRMLLPSSEIAEEEPVYVNAKQYKGILRRRQSRAKAEIENRLNRSRKPYLHESRHLHAMRRARGCGGRFLNTKNKESESSYSNTSSDGQSSVDDSATKTSQTQNLEKSNEQIYAPTQGFRSTFGVSSGAPFQV